MNTRISVSTKEKRYDQVVILMNKGRVTEAVDECERLLAEDPDDAHLYFLMGAVFVTIKKYADALEWLEKATKLQPGNLEYLNWYGDTLRLNGYFEKSEKILLDILEKNPKNDRALVSLGSIYDAFRHWHQAAEYFEKAVALKPSNSLAQKKLAEMLLHCGDTQAALTHAKKAQSLAPKEADTYHLLAIIYETQGEKSKATKFLEKSIQLDPASGAAFGELVKTRKITSDDRALIARMEKRLELGMPSEFRNRFHFALAKAHNDLKDYEKAFHHLHHGNLLLQGQFPLSQFRQEVKGTKKVYKSISMDQLQGSGNPSDKPIFVVGMPRSGTTLIDQILSSHSKVHSIGESEEIGFGGRDACEEAGISYKAYNLPQLSQELVKKYAQRYLDRACAEVPDVLRIVDKMPANCFNIGYILTLFPNARIIHSKRHPLDTALSCYFQRFTSSIYMEWSNDLTMLGHYYRGYVEIMDFWKKRFPDKILDVQYEDMVEDLETNVHRLVDFAGLDWEDACLEFHQSKRVVHTASLWQVRQPIYKSSVARWRPYAKHLGPLVESLGDILTEEDYQALREEGLDRKRPAGWARRIFAR